MLVGVVLGLVGSFWALRILQGWISGLTDVEPGIVAAAAVLLVAVSVGAILLPARRAASIDPLRALHHE